MPTSSPLKIHLQALGCRLNEAELTQWNNRFQQAGHGLASSVETADLMVLNTCAVTAEAVRKSRQLIHRLHRENPQARFVVTGCHASLSAEEVEQTLGVDLVIDNNDKDRLPELIEQRLNLPTQPQAATEPGAASLFKRGRQRAFIKVQDGCRFRCSYCIVTVARGEERSRPMADIINEIQQHQQQGIQEIVITGVQVGGYGHSQQGGSDSSLAELIGHILSDTDIPRIRMGSIEPWAIDESLYQHFSNPRFMPHLHLPLQSGADSVLRRMARKTRIADFANLVNNLRNVAPEINLTTDIIVGFPGETEDEWQQSLESIERFEFGHVHIFSYSDREGTKAAGLSNKIDHATKKQRSQQLHQQVQSSSEQQWQKQIGKTVEVLWEGNGKSIEDMSMKDNSNNANNEPLRYRGYTPNYHRVRTNSQQSLGSQITRATITGYDQDGLIAGNNIQESKN